MDDKPKAKTYSVTRGQIGVGASIFTAIMVLQPVKDFFYTRTEAEAQIQRTERIEVSIQEMKEELTRRLERNSDKIIENIRDSRAQAQRELDRVDKRIDMLEAFRREWNKTKTGG